MEFLQYFLIFSSYVLLWLLVKKFFDIDFKLKELETKISVIFNVIMIFLQYLDIKIKEKESES